MIINKPVKRKEKQLKITITLSEKEVKRLSGIGIEYDAISIPTLGSRMMRKTSELPTVTLTSWLQVNFLTELIYQLRGLADEHEI